MNKLYLYIRLSDADDDLQSKAESDSIANQRTLLHRYLQSHREFADYEMIEFVDDGFSGTNGHRPAFEQMIEHLKNGEAHVVICKDFSRFFRDYVEIGDYLERIFPFLGVRFIAVNDGYDSDEYKGTTAGMEVVMKYIVYAYYSRDLSQKIKTVMSTRKSKGEFVAAFAPYGYMKDPNRKRHMIPNPDTAPVVRCIFDMALQGKGTYAIARTLNDEHVETPAKYFMRTNPRCMKFRKTTSDENCWTSLNVREILKRREYTGVLVLNKRIWKGLDSQTTRVVDESEWKLVPNCHEAIVTQEEFEKAQSVMRQLKKADKVPHEYLLRGLLHCGACGRSLQRQPHNRHIYYKCEKSIANGSTTCPIGERFYEDELERIITNDLMEKLNLFVEKVERIQQVSAQSGYGETRIQEQLEQTNKKLKQISACKVAAYERYADGKLSKEEFLSERNRLNAETDEFATKKEALEQEFATLKQKQNRELIVTTKKAREVLVAEVLTNEMLKTFIERVDVFQGMRVEIRYRFGDLFRMT